MCECPPKKKLRQSSIFDMFSPSTSRETNTKKRDPPNVISNNSEDIESSIECMKLGSGSSNIGTEENIEKMETDANLGDADNDRKKDKKGRSKGKDEQEEKRRQMLTDFANPQVPGCSNEASKKKKRQSGHHETDETKSGDYRQRLPATSPKGKGNLKGSTPKKVFKKLSPKKASGKSPFKEQDRRKSGGEVSERRKILAEAAERRMSGQSKPSPEPNEADFSYSSDMFDDDFEEAIQEMEENGITWRGTPISSFPFISTTNLNVPPVCPAPNHTVMVQLPVTADTCPTPEPSSYRDAWDQFHVRMPCSPQSLYPLGKGSDSLVPRWSIIHMALSREMETVEDLQRAILEYNSRYAAKWKFRGLQMLLEEEFEEEESDFFFNSTLPAMVKLALNLPKIITQPIPLLTSHTAHSITLSQMQIASLLANAFFCTFPRRNAKGSETEYASYPDINFNRLFYHREKRSLEKLKCLINYFRRVTTKEPTGTVTFSRFYVNPQSMPSWETSSKQLPRLHIDTKGLIEEQIGLVQVDFANKFIGGGVLGLGCVQEEIRFVLSPELIVSRLFTQVLDKTEALIVIGVEQFNKGIGYASNFRWDGSHTDTTPRDPWGRRMCHVTAIDALHFAKQPKVQYRPSFILRELNKAYAGFNVLEGSVGNPVAIATGNWGCGAFKGNSRLKSLIQLAVCGYLGRDVAYFTFGDQKLRNDLSTMHLFLKENNVTVGELVQVLNHHGLRDWSDGSDLYNYIYHNLGAYDSETDNDTEESKGPTNKNLVSRDNSSTKLKTARSISEYFSKTSSLTNKNHQMNGKQTAGSKGPGPSSKTPSDATLTEEKILQVLTECDRLVEGKKGRAPSEESSSSLDNRKGECKFVNAPANTREQMNNSNDTEENNTSDAREPSKLLSYLDDIDKCLGL